MLKSLTEPELNLLNTLKQFLDPSSGMLEHPNQMPLNILFLSEYTGLSEPVISELIQSLTLKRVISINEMGQEVQYFLNPSIYAQNQEVNRTLRDIFNL